MSGDQTVYAALTYIGFAMRGDFCLNAGRFESNAGRFKPHTWRVVQDFDSRGAHKSAYVGQLSTDDPEVWRVVRRWTDEVLDVEFPTEDAAIVYAIMLTGGAG